MRHLLRLLALLFVAVPVAAFWRHVAESWRRSTWTVSIRVDD